MGEVLAVVVFFAVLVPGLLGAAFRRSPSFWVPGAVLMGLGLIGVVIGFGGGQASGHEENPMAGVGEGLIALAGMAAAVAGVTWLAVAGWLRSRDARTAQGPGVGLPPAIVVNQVTRT